MTSIGDDAFFGCKGLTRITIPNSVTSIGEGAFWDSGLTKVYSKIEQPFAINDAVFPWLFFSSATLYVPKGTKEKYQTTDGWKKITKIIEMNDAPVSNIEFADANVKTICVEYWDTNGDDELSYDEAAAVKDLEGEFAFKENITQFEELQYFIGLTSIGDWAFEGCRGLTSIIIPNSVTSIGEAAFSECGGLTSITIPNSVTSIGEAAFSECGGLISITIPNSVTSIGGAAFNVCGSLTNITIPNSVTSIGDFTFADCSSLTSITIPNSVTSIGEYAFEGCTGLTSITIPNSVTSIGEYAFGGCSGLTSITIPNSVTSIGWAAFSGCSGLTCINIPNSVTSIGSSAFDGCSGLTEVHSMIEQPFAIKVNVFTSYNIPLYVPKGTKEKYQATDGWKNFTNIIEVGDAPTGNIEFADAEVKRLCVENWDTDGDGELSYDEAAAVTELGSEFKANKNITQFEELQYFTGVTSIGENAFSGCSGLTCITIPNSVTTIRNAAFYGCEGLTSITIPNSVTSIGNYAFRYCSGLSSVSIGNSVHKIQYNAFQNCEGLTSITIEPSNSVFDSRDNCNAIIETETDKLIAGCKNSTIPNSVTSIGDHAFEGCIGFTSIDIPNSVTSIGYRAFADCTDLTSVIIPISVTSIGSNAFVGCTGLTSIIIPNSVTSIGKSAFQGCSGLTSITIPNSVTSIDAETFYGCSGLTSIDIPNNVTSIGKNAFKECNGLTSIAIPNSVTSIGSSAFQGCSGLTSITVESGNSVYDSRDNCNAIIETATNILITGCYNTTIPNNVTSIGVAAFWGCSGLTSIDIPNSVTSIGNSAFNDCGNLISITIPNSVTSIESQAFYICNGLTEIHSYIENPFSLDNNCWNGVNKSIPLYVPKGTKEKYQATDGWKNFTNIIEMDDEEPAENAMIDAAQTAIEYEKPYCIYTTFNGTEEGTQRYYLTTDGYLTSRPELAGIFTFYKTEGDDLFHSPGWKLDACFSNPKLSGNGGASGDLNPQGHILVDMASRDDWEGQVWYLDENGRFAVRATNAVYDGWGSSTFWTVLDTDGDGKPEADYSWTQAFVWQLESDITVVEVTPEDGDLTARVATSPSAWNAMGVCATTFAPAVTTSDGRSAQMVETYETTVDATGEMMYQTVSGLEEGYYAVELYANAQYTDGRGFGSDLKDGATDVVYVSANDRRSYVTAHVGTAVAENGVYTVCTPVSDGTLRISLVAEKPGTNWHTIQIKSLRKVDGIITANDLTMTYGDEVPGLTYFTEGAEVEGQPVLSCAATKASPAGTYPITISQGTVTNGNMGYAAGILTITKAPLKIKAGTYTKKQGEENPEFTLAYEGFVNGETEAVLTKEPTVTCEATKESASGEYAVNVAGAEAANYEISYVPGVLTVTAADDGIIAGDINGNDEVDDEDVDAFIELYLDDEIPEPGDADFSRFDANGDGIISLADAVAIFYLSNGLNFDGTDPNAARALSMDNGEFLLWQASQKAERIMDNYCEVTVEATDLGNGIVRYTLTSDFEYAGFAVDVKGAQVVSESAEGMTLRSAETKGKHRIVAYNFGQAAAAGTALTLDVLGEAQFSNINFSDANARNIRFRLSETTGIGAKPMDNGQWIIDNYYDLNGREWKSMKKGVNIIRNANGTKKVGVK